MLKILVVNTVPTSKNGITNVIMNYICSMNNKDVVFDLMSINAPDKIYREVVESRGGNVYVLPRNGKAIIKYWFGLRSLVKRNTYNIVYIHGNSHTTLLDLSAARAGGCVVGMVHAHNTACNHAIVHKVLACLFDRVCTDRIACGEEAGKFMFGDKPFRVLNNGVDTIKFAYDKGKRDIIRKGFCWDEGCVVIGHVGYFNKVKNHKFIVDIFSELYKANSHYRLLLIGDGELRKNVEKQISELELKEKVVLTGNVDNVSDYLNAMDFVIMPSLYEGLPLSLIEQQANGLPCFVSDTITREVDKTGYLMFLPLSKTAKEWASQIVSYKDGLTRKSRSEINIRCIKAVGYSIHEEADKLNEFFVDALK